MFCRAYITQFRWKTSVMLIWFKNLKPLLKLGLLQVPYNLSYVSLDWWFALIINFQYRNEKKSWITEFSWLLICSQKSYCYYLYWTWISKIPFLIIYHLWKLIIVEYNSIIIFMPLSKKEGCVGLPCLVQHKLKMLCSRSFKLGR